LIFVTVGEQLPFDRLISTIDDWASKSGVAVYAQIGNTLYRPNFIEYRSSLGPADFSDAFKTAELIIGHAGMGTIITALELNKPLLIMPRKASLGEHRNDHQFATAKRFIARGNISVAFDEIELLAKLQCLDEIKKIACNIGDVIPPHNLIDKIKSFILEI